MPSVKRIKWMVLEICELHTDRWWKYVIEKLDYSPCRRCIWQFKRCCAACRCPVCFNKSMSKTKAMMTDGEPCHCCYIIVVASRGYGTVPGTQKHAVWSTKALLTCRNMSQSFHKTHVIWIQTASQAQDERGKSLHESCRMQNQLQQLSLELLTLLMKHCGATEATCYKSDFLESRLVWYRTQQENNHQIFRFLYYIQLIS